MMMMTTKKIFIDDNDDDDDIHIFLSLLAFTSVIVMVVTSKR